MNKILFSLAIFSLFLIPAASFAISIEYGLTSLGGSAYQYDYWVTNDGSLGAGVGVSLFDITFDTNLYEETSLTIESPSAMAAEWLESILFSAPGVPAVYDAYALGSGILTSESGFAVRFCWLDAVTLPGAQAFTIYDPNTFEILEEGITTLKNNQISPVPEPGTIVLVGTGLIGLVFFRRRMKHS